MSRWEVALVEIGALDAASTMRTVADMRVAPTLVSMTHRARVRVAPVEANGHERKIGVRRLVKQNRGARAGRRRGAGISKSQLNAPASLDLVEAFEKSSKFLGALPEAAFDYAAHPRLIGRRRRLAVDFRDLHTLSADAGVALIAQTQRICRKRRGLLRLTPDEDPPSIRENLAQLGLYSLVDARSDQINTVPNGDRRFVRFETARLADGAKIASFIHRVRELVGEGPHPSALYDSLMEAACNSVEHAYKGWKAPFPQVAHWWGAACYDQRRRFLNVCIYDLGRGIPRTVSEKSRYRSFVHEGQSDAAKLEIAIRYGKRSSRALRADGRGRGLWAMVDLVGNHGSVLRLWSGKGMITYEAGEVLKTNLPFEIHGTLVEWALFI